jgi:hypothetical protein
MTLLSFGDALKLAALQASASGDSTSSRRCLAENAQVDDAAPAT